MNGNHYGLKAAKLTLIARGARFVFVARFMFGCLVVCVGLALPLCRALAAGEINDSPLSQLSASHTLTLDEAYRLAVGNEEQVKISESELVKAQLLPWRAMTLLTPRADVTGTFTRNKEEIAFTGVGGGGGGSTAFPSVIRPLESWVGTFSVTQPLIQPSFIPSWQLGKDAIRQNEQPRLYRARSALWRGAGVLRCPPYASPRRCLGGYTQTHARRIETSASALSCGRGDQDGCVACRGRIGAGATCADYGEE